MWCYWMPLCMLLILRVHGADQHEQQPNKFGISSCLFSTKSQLSYYCSEPGEKFPTQPILTDKLNTHEKMEKLCGHYSNEAVCYNFFLLFLYSQANGLCVAVDADKSKVFDQREVSVHLLIGGFNHQYSPYCGKLESSSVDKSYTFSCTMDPSLRKAVVTVIGYNTTMEDEWKSTFKVTVEDDCLEIKDDSEVLHISRETAAILISATYAFGCLTTLFFVGVLCCRKKIVKLVLCGERARINLESRLFELDSSDAVEATTAFIIAKSPIPTTSDESLNCVASVEEKSQHQQDDSSENTEISSLPIKVNNFIPGPPP